MPPGKDGVHDMNSGFGFQQLIELCQRTHQEMQSRAGRSVDTFLVVRNWLFGWYIVEYEQNGADRAEYGRRFLVTLSKRLQEIGIRGSSPTRLKLYRAFYQQHRGIGPTVSDQLAMLLPFEGQPGIRPTASDESLSGLAETPHLPEDISNQLIKHFSLGWSHYVALLSIDNADERRFYEIEAELEEKRCGDGGAFSELDKVNMQMEKMGSSPSGERKVESGK